MTLRDASSIPRDSVVDTDVCIVGAGPAGIAIALELLGSGRRIVLIEGGGTEFTRSLRQPHKILREHLSGEQSLARGENVGFPYYRLRMSRVRAFGGSSRARFDHGLRAFPLSPIDFETRPGLPWSGWPFGYEELAPHYQRAQRICGLGPRDYVAETWLRAGAPAPPSLHGSELANAVMQHATPEHFAGYLDTLRDAPNVDLILHAVTTEIASDDGPSSVSHVQAASLDGNRFRVRARAYVLAAGGIENARLLLVSRDAQPEGLGNGGGLVGRYFMEHPHLVSGFLRPSSPGAFDTLAAYLPRGVDGDWVRLMLQPEAEVMRREQLLNVVFELNTTYAERADPAVHGARTIARAIPRGPISPRLLGPARRALRGLPSVARVASARLRGGYTPDMFEIHAMAEQAPDPSSRVTLSEKRDELGVPLTRLDWRVSSFDWDSLRRSMQILHDGIRASGLGEVQSLLDDDVRSATIFGGWHHLGTTRMARDERSGVVDEHCRVHGVANLYVAGSSVFPTGGCANPTLTIVALSLRLAERLREELGAQPAPALWPVPKAR